MIFDFAINQYYPTKNNIAHYDNLSHHNFYYHLYFFHFVKDQSN